MKTLKFASEIYLPLGKVVGKGGWCVGKQEQSAYTCGVCSALVESNLVNIGYKDLFAGAYEVVTPVRKPVHNVKD